MGKVKNRYVCSNCGYETPKWWGICPRCSSAGTMEEEIYTLSPKNKKKEIILSSLDDASPIPLSEVEGKDYSRFSTKINEFDRVLGGGLVKGSLVLIGGDPGIGKSTILLQLASNISQEKKVLYVSAEESAQQIKLRAERIIPDKGSNILILAQTNMEAIENQISEKKPELLIIDSIQTISSDLSDSPAGSVSQVKDIANRLMKICKKDDISCFIVGHVTKDGAIAGPRVLEHLVDTVLYFEGEKFNSYRIIRAVKNRFGSTDELSVFEMTDRGLKEVTNPSKALLSSTDIKASGTTIVSTVEGTRAILVEIQALVIKSYLPSPRRTCTGMDYNRLNMLIAVIEKRIGIPIQPYDVYVNLAGGIKINEPSIDMGVILAICSSYYDRPAKEDMCVFGEVGLSGEIRPASFLVQRVKEAEKIGYKKIILPYNSSKEISKNDFNIEIIGVKTVDQLIKIGLEKKEVKN